MPLVATVLDREILEETRYCIFRTFQEKLAEQYAWNDFYFFEFTKASFMAQDVICPGEGSMCTWEKGDSNTKEKVF